MPSIILQTLQTSRFFIIDSALKVTYGSREDATSFHSHEEALTTLIKAARLVRAHAKKNQKLPLWVQEASQEGVTPRGIVHRFTAEERLELQDLAAPFDVYYIRRANEWLSYDLGQRGGYVFEKTFFRAIAFTDAQEALSLVAAYETQPGHMVSLLKATSQFTEVTLSDRPHLPPDQVASSIAAALEAQAIARHIEQSQRASLTQTSLAPAASPSKKRGMTL